MSRHTWCNYTGCLWGHECSLNSAHWCTPFTTIDLHRISQTVRHCTDCCDCNYSLRSSIICHYGLCRAAYTFQVRWAGLRVCRTCCLEPPSRSHSQITFVASLHLQPSEDIWKRFYSLKFLTLPKTFNIVMSAGHLCKWTQNRRWWWWCTIKRIPALRLVV